MSEPIGHLCNAAIVLILISALLLGMDVKAILIIFLIFEAVGSVLLAFSAVLDPIIDFVKKARG